MATDDSTEKLSYIILVDPPDCSYETSAPGLIFAARGLGQMLGQLDPGTENFADVCSYIQTSFMLIAEGLADRLGVPLDEIEAVERQIAEARNSKQAGAS